MITERVKKEEREPNLMWRHLGDSGLGPASTQVRKNKPQVDSRLARDLLGVKCFNYEQLGHIFSSCSKLLKHPKMPLLGKD